MRNSLLAVVLLFASSSSVFAGQVSVTVSGTALEGGPAFEASIGGKPVGSATVDPIPANGGVSTFTFEVADKVLNAGGDFTVRLTNDYAVEGKGDRNLFLFEATVGDAHLKSTDFRIVADGGVVEREAMPFLGVWTNTEVATASAPKDGWLGPLETQCRSAKAVIEGFANNSAELGAWGKRRLRRIVSIASKRKCAVSVLGYSSANGPYDQNTDLAKLRAQSVMDYLASRGLKFKSSYVEGVGVTNEFGSPASNRRVVVEIKN